MDNINKKTDIDIEETNDWIDSLKDLILNHGHERAKFIVNSIIDEAKSSGVNIQNTLTTDYINTFPIDKQKPYTGDRAIERKIKSIIRWNAMAMVVRANRENPGIGGHISSFASSATLYEVGFNHFFKGPQNPN